MIREMSLRNALLQRSDNDWLDGLLAEKPEYEGSLRMVVGMSAWMYDIANSPFAMRTLAASEAGSREVSASATAMREVSASATAMREVSASATAMREVSASENAVAVILGTDQALATVVASAVAMSAISASAVAMSAISASAVAMSAISASAVARDAIKNNPTAYASVLGNHMAVGKFAVGAAGLDPAPYADIEAVAASSTAMQAVAASSTAMQAVAASTAARTALWQSDAFLACLQANNASIQAIISANLATTKDAASSSFQFEAQGTKLILLRRYYNGATESDHLQWDRNGSNLPGYGQPNTYDATYARSASAPTANNATANCVRACSGLNRATWTVGNQLTVIYLKV